MYVHLCESVSVCGLHVCAFVCKVLPVRVCGLYVCMCICMLVLPVSVCVCLIVLEHSLSHTYTPPISIVTRHRASASVWSVWTDVPVIYTDMTDVMGCREE